METTTIKAKKDLFNMGKCFTKGKEYTVNKKVELEASLMECRTTNDKGEKHVIGSFWRDFEIVKQVN